MSWVVSLSLEVSLDGAHQVVPIHLAIFTGLCITTACDEDHTSLINFEVKDVSILQVKHCGLCDEMVAS